MTELRPPEQWAHLRWHFLRHASRYSQLRVFGWFSSYWETDGGFRIWPGMPNGWTYIGPAVAVTADDAQVELVAREIDPEAYWRDDCSGYDDIMTIQAGSYPGHLHSFRVAVKRHEAREKARAALAALIRGK